MIKKKSTKKYYFTVEGETEQWYLKWLEGVINSADEAAYKVSKLEKLCKITLPSFLKYRGQSVNRICPLIK